MEILGPKEFKKKNKNCTYNDYLDYLENIKKELTDNLTKDGTEKLQIVNKYLDIVKMYKKEIIYKTIDSLSLEELQGIYKYDKKIESLENEINKFKEKKQVLEKQYNEYNSKIDASLDCELVKIPYTLECFSPFSNFKSAEEYIKDILSKGAISETFDTNFINLLKTYSRNDLEIDQILLMKADFINLINKFHQNVLKYPNNLEKIVKLFLSEVVVGRIFKGKVHVDYYSFIYDLMTLEHNSYISDLTNALNTTREKSNTADLLRQTLSEMQQNIKLDNSLINQEYIFRLENLKREMAKVNYLLTGLETEKENFKEFMSDKDKIKETLKEQTPCEFQDRQISFQEICKAIAEENKKRSLLKEQVLKVWNTIQDKNSEIAQLGKELDIPNIYETYLVEEKNKGNKLAQIVDLQNSMDSLRASIKRKSLLYIFKRKEIKQLKASYLNTRNLRDKEIKEFYYSNPLCLDNFIKEIIYKQWDMDEYNELTILQKRLLSNSILSALDKKERQELLDLEVTLISILDKAYFEKKQEREAKEKFINDIKEEIKELNDYLLQNQNVLINLGLIPANDKVLEDNNDDIKDLGLNGINTLEDALFYQDFMADLNDYNLSSEELNGLISRKL